MSLAGDLDCNAANEVLFFPIRSLTHTIYGVE